jgi:hypothetical protein
MTMRKRYQRRFIVARILANVLLVFLVFAMVIPNLIVPTTTAAPQHFDWGGLISPFIISGVLTICIWFLV